MAQTNCHSMFTSKIHIDRHLTRELSSQSCSRDLLSPMRQKQSGVLKFKWLQHCFLCGEDCYINVDPKHLDQWRDSFECRTSDRGKGNIVFKEVILQVSAIKPSMHYPYS